MPVNEAGLNVLKTDRHRMSSGSNAAHDVLVAETGTSGRTGVMKRNEQNSCIVARASNALKCRTTNSEMKHTGVR